MHTEYDGGRMGIHGHGVMSNDKIRVEETSGVWVCELCDEPRNEEKEGSRDDAVLLHTKFSNNNQRIVWPMGADHKDLPERSKEAGTAGGVTSDEKKEQKEEIAANAEGSSAAVADTNAPQVIAEVEPEFKTYRLRFLIAAAVFLANASNALIWSTYSAITPTTTSYYSTQHWVINTLSLTFSAVFLPFIFPAMWLIDNKGLRPALLIGSFGTALGSGIRCLSFFAPTGSKLAVLFVGQIVAGFAQPFLLDTPTKAAAHWFSEKERVTANTIMNLGQPIGTAIIFGMAPGVVNADDPSTINLLNLITFIMTLALAVPSLFVKNKPPAPPSKSANEASIPFWQGAKQLLRNPAFLLLSVIFGLVLGLVNTFLTFSSDYVTPFGYSESDAGNIGVIVIAVGIVSAGILGPVLDRTKAHVFVMKCLTLVLLIGTILFTLGSYPNRLGLLYTASAVLGIGGVPILPISLEIGVEATYPIAEGTSSGVLWAVAIFWTIVLTIVSNALRNPVDNSLRNAQFMFLGVMFVPVVAALFYNYGNKRMQFERSHEVFHETHLDEEIEMESSAAVDAADGKGLKSQEV